MTRKKRICLSLKQKLQILRAAGIGKTNSDIQIDINKHNDIEDFDIRVKKILGLINDKQRKNTNMIYFIMYDIENNKVRTLISKFLIKQGCTRIQRSIFLTDSPPEKYELIKTSLTEIQSFYENNDSILIVPISSEHIKAMKIIGQSIDVDIIIKNKNTIFY